MPAGTNVTAGELPKSGIKRFEIVGGVAANGAFEICKEVSGGFGLITFESVTSAIKRVLGHINLSSVQRFSLCAFLRLVCTLYKNGIWTGAFIINNILFSFMKKRYF